MATLPIASELVPQSDLNLSSRIEYAVVSATGHAKCAAGGVAVDSTKHMAIERVRNIQFEDDVLAFYDAGPLYDRKVLVDVTRTANIAERHWKVSEDIALLSYQGGGCVRIQKSSAVEEIICASGCECSVGVRFASAVRAEGIERRCVRADERAPGMVLNR